MWRPFKWLFPSIRFSHHLQGFLMACFVALFCILLFCNVMIDVYFYVVFASLGRYGISYIGQCIHSQSKLWV